MAGISSRAAGSLINRKKYNGIEYDDDLDLDIYEAYYRNLDAQTGRWWEIDPKIEDGQEMLSPYSSMANDPILKSDPLGDVPESNLSSTSEGSCCPTAGIVAKWGLKAGAAIIVAGLGPEDLPADGVAGVVVTVVEAAAGLVAIWEWLSDPVVIPKPAPPASPVSTLTPTKVQSPTQTKVPVPTVVVAHGRKAQSTGKLKDNHGRGYEHGKTKLKQKENRNKKRGADERRNKGKIND